LAMPTRRDCRPGATTPAAANLLVPVPRRRSRPAARSGRRSPAGRNCGRWSRRTGPARPRSPLPGPKVGLYRCDPEPGGRNVPWNFESRRSCRLAVGVGQRLCGRSYRRAAAAKGRRPDLSRTVARIHRGRDMLSGHAFGAVSEPRRLSVRPRPKSAIATAGRAAPRRIFGPARRRAPRGGGIAWARFSVGKSARLTDCERAPTSQRRRLDGKGDGE